MGHGLEHSVIDRRESILAQYMRWIEPILFPASVIPCLMILAEWSTPTFLACLICLPFASVGLFLVNNTLFKRLHGSALFRTTPRFAATILIAGFVTLFVFAAVPLVVASLVGDSSFPAVRHSGLVDRLSLAGSLALTTTIFGTFLRTILLAMEEFRFLARTYFDAQHLAR